MKLPLVYDLMRAETFWQDRKLNSPEDSGKNSKDKRKVAPK
jgi:hypothetical protein